LLAGETAAVCSLAGCSLDSFGGGVGMRGGGAGGRVVREGELGIGGGGAGGGGVDDVVTLAST